MAHAICDRMLMSCTGERNPISYDNMERLPGGTMLSDRHIHGLMYVQNGKIIFIETRRWLL